MESSSLEESLKLQDNDYTNFDVPVFVTCIKQETDQNITEFTYTIGFVKEEPTEIIFEPKDIKIERPCNSSSISQMINDIKTETVVKEEILNTCIVKQEETSNETLVETCDLIKSEEISIKDDEQETSAIVPINDSDQEQFDPPATDDQEQRDHKIRQEKLKQHHLNTTEGGVYKCYQCDFQTNYKRFLKLHFLEHENRDDIKMFKCSKCDFQTIYRNSLQLHLSKHEHEQGDRGKVHKCTKCKFHTMYKSSLKQHLLRHEHNDTAEIHKCNQCGYQTIYKSYIRMHVLKHESPNSDKVHKCNKCDFQTVYEESYKLHLLRHEESEAVKKVAKT